MQRQLTLSELKRLADEAFADAQTTIETALRIADDCRRLTAELKRSKEEFRQGTASARAATAS